MELFIDRDCLIKCTGEKMTDSEFLKWIYARLVKIHNEDPMYDYMHRLEKVIKNLEERGE